MKSEERRREELQELVKRFQAVMVGAVYIGTKLANGKGVAQSETDAFTVQGKELADAMLKEIN